MTGKGLLWATLIGACLASGAAAAGDAVPTPSPSPPIASASAGASPGGAPQAIPPSAEDAEMAAAAVRNMREEKWREAARAYQDSLGPDAPRGSAGLCCHPTPYGTQWCH
ncbi:hypothetical protein [Nitrospirillum sp. BR 11828]|uniref:hypothetical protein n=1 Tax=Nitrospirillum sp. BR 11828 TaxID=3104325 RepID=UPI002ACA6812|nr:hypothetical protein [Nitrospirillum sp. BR 11828]MDZ5649805.1 hypothetical protein [Nitrospirillum sp. BR 11828]